MRWPAFFVWARLVLAFAALLAAGVSTQRFTLTLQPVVLEIVIRALSTYLPRTVLTATPFIVVGTGIYQCGGSGEYSIAKGKNRTDSSLKLPEPLAPIPVAQRELDLSAVARLASTSIASESMLLTCANEH